MIKNIIFDIGAVLVEFDPVRVLKDMGLSDEEAAEIAKDTALGPHWKELDRGVLPREDVFNMMVADVPDTYKKDAEKFLQKEALKTVRSFDYSENWLKQLKLQGFNVYLLTNYPDWMFQYHWENTFTFTDYVDGKIVSAREKLIKPDPEIYKRLLDRYNLKAEECVFVDDRLENIQAAVRLGIRGVHFTGFDETKATLDKFLKSGK